MNHPFIIGAGGVASYLLPVLIKTFRPQQLTIIDKDKLEERNLDRQMFTPKQIGLNKARALCELYVPKDTVATVIDAWFAESTDVPVDIDAIICVADNHKARRDALALADRIKVRCYLGGNEYFDSQAFVYEPRWSGGPKDPRIAYPEIATSEEGSPFRCTGEALEAFPQLAVANLNCAAKLLHLMWLYEKWLPENQAQLDPKVIENTLPNELFSTLF